MFSNFSRVPRSIMDANVHEDGNPIEMECVFGTIPNDLLGHVFIIAPADGVDVKGLPYKDGSTFLNGNGMIYRLDFDCPGTVKLKRKLVKSLDYKVDQAIQNNQDNKYHEWLKFKNYGIVRFSWFLGVRNQLNTAFLPMKFGEEDERLLVTYDAGRPYEIDTDTLETVTPIGRLDEWKPGVSEPLFPFPLILSSAHPAFDGDKNQMFTVNYGRSLFNLLEINPKKIEYWQPKTFLKALKSTWNEIITGTFIKKVFLNSLFDDQEKNLSFRSLIESILKIIPNQWLGFDYYLELLLKIVSNLKNQDADFVYLMCWDGVNFLQKWKLIESNGSPVRLNQSIHQIGVTKDYVVLMDTAFATGMEQVITNIPDILPINERKFVANRPSPDSTLYIVRRDHLKDNQKTVVAYPVTIPREASHFLVDYENPNDKITLHIAHISAWDIAEWIRQEDKFPGEHRSVPRDLVGTQQGQMDISYMGRHVIDVSTLGNPELPIESTIMSHSACTWGPGLSTYSPSLGITPKKLDNIYWVSFGLWKELTIEFMYDQYQDYKYRQIPLDKLLELAKEGIPSCLYRLDTQSMTIPDYYQSEPGHLLLSPQFVPRRNRCTEDSTNGYIVCVAFTPERNEIWIFDAQKLNKGPQCKLYYPNLNAQDLNRCSNCNLEDRNFNIGLSLHTAWLEKISLRQAKYKVSVTKDYQEVVQNWLKFIEDLQELTHEQKHEIKREIEYLFQREIDSNFKFD